MYCILGAPTSTFGRAPNHLAPALPTPTVSCVVTNQLPMIRCKNGRSQNALKILRPNLQKGQMPLLPKMKQLFLFAQLKSNHMFA